MADLDRFCVDGRETSLENLLPREAWVLAEDSPTCTTRLLLETELLGRHELVCADAADAALDPSLRHRSSSTRLDSSHGGTAIEPPSEGLIPHVGIGAPQRRGLFD